MLRCLTYLIPKTLNDWASLCAQRLFYLGLFIIFMNFRCYIASSYC